MRKITHVLRSITANGFRKGFLFSLTKPHVQENETHVSFLVMFDLNLSYYEQNDRRRKYNLSTESLLTEMSNNIRCKKTPQYRYTQTHKKKVSNQAPCPLRDGWSGPNRFSFDIFFASQNQFYLMTRSVVRQWYHRFLWIHNYVMTCHGPRRCINSLFIT